MIRCKCDKCFLYDELKSHLQKCPSVMVECRFCKVSHLRGSPPNSYIDRYYDLTEHESQCGSKTVLCYHCQKSVVQRDLPVHLRTFHSDNFTPENQSKYTWKCPVCQSENKDLDESCQVILV